MSPAVPSPRRPDDVAAGLDLVALAEAYQARRLEVRDGRVHLDDPVRAERVFDDAVAALAVATALVERLHAARWSVVRDALAAAADRAPR